MAWSQPSSKLHRLLFWSLAVLAVVMVFSVSFAFWKLRGGVREGRDTPSSNVSSGQNADAVKIEKKELSGFIAEVIGESDASEKWVVLSVTAPSATLPEEASSGEVEMKTTRYKFYLGKDLESTKDIHGGESVTVSFPSAVSHPSGDEQPDAQRYIAAENIEVIQ